jgi:hypothetical protein
MSLFLAGCNVASRRSAGLHRVVLCCKLYSGSATTTTTTTLRRQQGGYNNNKNSWMQVDARVESALRAGKPVVALESTIVAHGMPYPENLRLSQRVAVILRNKGVEPATIGTSSPFRPFGRDERKCGTYDCVKALPLCGSDILTYPPLVRL